MRDRHNLIFGTMFFSYLAVVSFLSFSMQTKALANASAVPVLKQKQEIIKKEIKITPNSPALQGNTVYITVKSPKTLKNPYFIYKGKKINLYKKGKGVYKGLLGLSAFEKTGNFKISFKDLTGYLSDVKNLNIKVKRYPNQYIRLSGKSSGITATKEELRKVGWAKSVVTQSAYWSTSQGTPFVNPTKGCISSIYGLNRFYNGTRGSYHKGVDIAAPNGQKVVSTANGKVLVSRMFRLHGATVAIDHGQGVVSMYLHLSKLNVKEGEIVKIGQKIAEVGSTGISTGPHLHWGLYLNGVPIDPIGVWTPKVPKCK